MELLIINILEGIVVIVFALCFGVFVGIVWFHVVWRLAEKIGLISKA